jgi:hypothetical protein
LGDQRRLGATSGLGGRGALGTRQPEGEQHGDGGEPSRPPERHVERVSERSVVRGDGALEDHRQDGGAERAAYLLGRAGQHAGVGDLLPVEADVGGDHQGHGDGAEAESPDDHPEGEQPRAGVRPGEGERHGRGGDDDAVGQDDAARTEPVDIAPGDGAGQDAADALRDEHDPGR